MFLGPWWHTMWEYGGAALCRAVWAVSPRVSSEDLEMADRWFLKYGEAAVLISRMLPVVRTFISLPAGIVRMNVPKFVLFSFIGAVPWCYLLAYIGLKLGERWDGLHEYFHHLDVVIGMVLVLGFVYFLWSHWPRAKPQAQ